MNMDSGSFYEVFFCIWTIKNVALVIIILICCDRCFKKVNINIMLLNVGNIKPSERTNDG